MAASKALASQSLAFKKNIRVEGGFPGGGEVNSFKARIVFHNSDFPIRVAKFRWPIGSIQTGIMVQTDTDLSC